MKESTTVIDNFMYEKKVWILGNNIYRVCTNVTYPPK